MDSANLSRVRNGGDFFGSIKQFYERTEMILASAVIVLISRGAHEHGACVACAEQIKEQLAVVIQFVVAQIVSEVDEGAVHGFQKT